MEHFEVLLALRRKMQEAGDAAGTGECGAYYDSADMVSEAIEKYIAGQATREERGIWKDAINA